MRHRNELMKREVLYQKTIKDLQAEVQKVTDHMNELKDSMKVILENTQHQLASQESLNTFNNTLLRKAHNQSTQSV